MNLSHANPYGAVPAALKETRMALRDIMADYLATKTQEANLTLAQKKAETDTALIAANLQRDKLAGERDLARMAQDAQRFGLQTDLQRAQMEQSGRQFNTQLAENQRQFDVNKRLEERKIGLQGAQLNLQRLQAAAYQPGRAIDIARRHYPDMDEGRLTRVLKAAGINPNTITTPEILKGREPMLLPIYRFTLQEDFKTIRTQADSTKDPAAKQRLLAQAHDIALQAHGLDQLMRGGVSDKDAAQLYYKQKEAGTIADDMTFDQFRQGLKTAADGSTTGIKMIEESALALGKHAVDPDYDKNFLNAINMIRMLDDDPKHVAAIEQGLRERAADPADALAYAQGWSDHFLKQHRQGTTTPVPGGAAPDRPLWQSNMY